MKNYQKLSDFTTLSLLLITGFGCTSKTDTLTPNNIALILQLWDIIKYDRNIEKCISKANVDIVYMDKKKPLLSRKEIFQIKQLYALGITNRSIFKKSCYYGFTKNIYLLNQYHQRYRGGLEKISYHNKIFPKHVKRHEEEIVRQK